MNHYFVDLHIHIGRTASGRPVKITGAKTLTLSAILEQSSLHKGMDVIGVIDCHVPEVIFEIEELLNKGRMEELTGGGLRYNNTTLILGSEIEIYDENCKGPIHLLVYVPTLDGMKQLSSWMASHMKNVTLSSQRLYVSAKKLQQVVKELGGLFIPAHVFTPHKSLYGKGVKQSLEEVLNPDLIDAIELGLSSNTEMADHIKELHNYTYVSNSDAHSLPKIGREYQVVAMESPTFNELRLALQERDGRKIVANYGLNPLLGKYHRTSCEKCNTIIEENELSCINCGSKQITKGVFDRLQELRNVDNDTNAKRPPYIHQVPLDFIPKLGPKTLQKLRDYFGTEMKIIHEVPQEALEQVVSKEIATAITKARFGQLSLKSGGAGVYGKVEL
ncbi:TIGR00375 family protein [Lottiidibacillus patelloidae]|uniref:TIGR00375 family protein n=1 Tax=Lottiidibacillus patelloidae TaxID=2670334 RepID=A0A263BZL3_9BACI|nr:endonuclease Q family protein [Lottiidibacillus patelloidae]OZM58707.1 TIGR00375 family protein [Lottiidibacillus patelloidae]